MIFDEDCHHLFFAVGIALMMLITYVSADRKLMPVQTDTADASIYLDDGSATARPAGVDVEGLMRF
jgi:hypothetical protein